ncbi:DUF6232 family protein [Streptomyces sp. NPDC048258]|uniref:DUF6232 family protein n=1 Tax=Streptomyces sp. NPDC048258 TaxID=3365527 RepID=UPI003713C823
MARREVIQVRVSKRVLWIGGEAYPLQNIARATTWRIDPERGRAVGQFIKSMLTLGILTVIAFAALQGVAGDQLMNGVTFAALALAAFFLYRLISVLTTRTYYALVIETSGTPRTLLASADQQEVQQLVLDIMEAIDDPHADFSRPINTYNIGQIGDNYHASGRGGVGRIG